MTRQQLLTVELRPRGDAVEVGQLITSEYGMDTIAWVVGASDVVER